MVLIVRDEAAVISGCLKRLDFADDVVVVVDDRSRDATEALARSAGARVFIHEFHNFSDMKNFALSQAQGDWVLVLDADERVTGPLRAEIQQALQTPGADGFVIPFESYFFGQRMRYGGWQHDEHVRLFRRGAARYEGDIHEQLIFAPGRVIGRLVHPIAHLSHRNITHNMLKTVNYADVQAAEMLAAGEPPVRARTLLKVVAREFYRRMIRGRGYRDGMPGLIEAIYQPFSLFVVHVRLWELQQSPPLEEQYRQLDERLP